MPFSLTGLACAWRGAVRALRSAPALSAAIVATLAVAAGVNLAMLGLVDRLLLSPPPHLQDPSSLRRVAFAVEGPDGTRGAMTTTSFPAFEAMRDHVPGFAGVGAFVAKSFTAAVGDERIQVNGALVSGSYFGTLGATPLRGRFIRDEDDRTEADPVIVVSHRLWSSRLAQGAHPVPTIDIAGRPFTIVGVAKPGFTGHTSAQVDVWLPIALGLNEPGEWRFNPGRNIVSVVVRMAPAVSPDVAATQATGVAARPGQKVVLAPLVPGWAGASSSPDTRIALWLAGISGLVFVTGIANAGTLLLISAARRSHDIAVQRTLGASRAWLITQVGIESTLLSFSQSSPLLPSCRSRS
jgi:hypothetical protein